MLHEWFSPPTLKFWRITGIIPSISLLGKGGNVRGVTLTVVLTLLVVTHVVAAVQVGPLISHDEVCEPSGAVALPEGSFGQMFVMAEDEHNILRVYRAGESSKPLVISSGDLNTHLKLDPANEDDKADLEAAMWLNHKVYWIGSHSRSKKGKLRKARWQFFSTTIQVNGASIRILPSVSYHNLLAAFATLDPVLSKAIQLDVQEKESLAPEKEGFNIEGITASADGKSILIGLRNPLSANKEALLVSLQNPEAVVETGAKPVLDKLIMLDLEGRGVRSIEYSVGAQSYFIVAGPTGNNGTFELYRWSGHNHDQPTAVNGSAAAFAAIPDFHPEAMFIDPSGRKLHLLSDDGDRKMDGEVTCKNLGADKRSFRSVVVTLEE
jgi:hypothetical protein